MVWKVESTLDWPVLPKHYVVEGVAVPERMRGAASKISLVFSAQGPGQPFDHSASGGQATSSHALFINSFRFFSPGDHLRSPVFLAALQVTLIWCFGMVL